MTIQAFYHIFPSNGYTNKMVLIEAYYILCSDGFCDPGVVSSGAIWRDFLKSNMLEEPVLNARCFRSIVVFYAPGSLCIQNMLLEHICCMAPEVLCIQICSLPGLNYFVQISPA